MPRNASGIYSQPASSVNPPIPVTLISSVAFAGALTDIATELTNSLDRLGRGGMTAILSMGGFKISNLAAAVFSTDAARLGDVAAHVPAGAIMDFAMSTPPVGWLECNGSAVSRTTFATLFAAIGTTWGAGDGSTTFNLPAIRGRFRRAWDNGAGIDPARVFASVQDDGFASHTHVQNAHNHAISDPSHQHGFQQGQGAAAFAGGGFFAHNSNFQNATAGAFTGITINNTTAVNQSTGGTETTVKNVAVLTCIRT